MSFYQWGVDSAENVTEDLYQCVMHYFGHPKFWGRYLVRVQDVSEGLTREEISFIHSKGIRLLPIYNDFRAAEGFNQGRNAANNAVFYAQNLEIPLGIPIFANIERYFQIDKEWIQGWTGTILQAGYRSGFYNDPVTGNFNHAFCQAAKENKIVLTENILWSAEPVLELDDLIYPLNYEPKAPTCGGNVWIWQYSRQMPQCPIDMNIANISLTELLW
ncbi:MAG: glycoside hydrolase domain-containing protein [Anaerovoracaceae bacterium]